MMIFRRSLSPRAVEFAAAALLVFGGFEATGAAEVAAQVAPRLGILPASVLRNASTTLARSVLPGFSPTGWVGLVCGPVRCELRPVKLELVDPQTGADDINIGYAQAGRREPVKGEHTIVLLRGFAAIHDMSIPTWFTLRTPRVPQDAASGSMGVTILGPERLTWQLVPRWNPKGSNDFLTFYLESKGQAGAMQRQALGRISMEAVHTGVSPKDVLIWAGDLDGDGKIDLITRMGPKSAQPGLQLWLSTRAEGDDLVGPAAELGAWTDVEEAEGC